jgi:hypothetical protein
MENERKPIIAKRMGRPTLVENSNRETRSIFSTESPFHCRHLLLLSDQIPCLSWIDRSDNKHSCNCLFVLVKLADRLQPVFETSGCRWIKHFWTASEYVM